ncbi:hypothetical protein F9L07_19690 [Pimelobacter simplex]|uniref:Uncharacterized protein n=1 Tax=Nocardioides simplex TaxID=2045 RepID=A0A7J5DW19_NOCSI|nr:hypothetical protein [Pimelobacter simplex]KAB2809266.1 hypothetical protein F9L07_19690 [Pimelobacter simplex]
MTEQIEPGIPADATLSPTVVLIDQRLAELDGGVNSIGLQEGWITKARADLEAAEAKLAACLAEKARLEADRALLASEIPTDTTDPEGTA